MLNQEKIVHIHHRDCAQVERNVSLLMDEDALYCSTWACDALTSTLEREVGAEDKLNSSRMRHKARGVGSDYILSLGSSCVSVCVG